MPDVRPEAVHVLLRRVRKHARRVRPKVLARAEARLRGGRRAAQQRAGRRPVGPVRREATRRHLLEAERERALRRAGRDERVRLVQRRAARRAVVVHVRDRDARQPEAVERTLAAGGGSVGGRCVEMRSAYLSTGGLAVAVANVGRFDGVVGNACIYST